MVEARRFDIPWLCKCGVFSKDWRTECSSCGRPRQVKESLAEFFEREGGGELGL